MAYVNRSGPHCVNQMGKTQSKLLAERHDKETAWERHSMCELAFTLLVKTYLVGLSVFAGVQLRCPSF
jgi:hypothetical protein